MGKTIEIRLSDAQHAALIAEAEASNHHLFDYCRAKLMAPHVIKGRTIQRTERPVNLPEKPPQTHWGPTTTTAVRVEPPDDARMSRIEDALSRLTEYVLGGQQPTEPQPQQPHDPIDVDSLVSAQFAEAEAQGLTEYVPDEAEQQLASSGVRPLSRRPIPFSAHSAPRHLRELG